MAATGLASQRSSFQFHSLPDRRLIKADAISVLSTLNGLVVAVVRLAFSVRDKISCARFEAPRAVPANSQRLIVSYANLGDF
jgi:hypothetical protein